MPCLVRQGEKEGPPSYGARSVMEPGRISCKTNLSTVLRILQKATGIKRRNRKSKRVAAARLARGGVCGMCWRKRGICFITTAKKLVCLLLFIQLLHDYLLMNSD